MRLPLAWLSEYVHPGGDPWELADALSATGTEVAGTANRFIITSDTGVSAHSGTVGAIGSGADIELPSLTVTAAATQTLQALVLRCAADGTISTEASIALQ